MELGLVGKPNVGKSTFFSAATLATAAIANYPFTTVQPNRGVAYVRATCPHKEIGVACNPNHGACQDGTRLVPVEMLDVAGLVPKAHEGRGLGNQFLDDLRQASAFIHIVDASGSTDFEGNPVERGRHDPREDVAFLEDELAYWIRGVMIRNWEKSARQAELESVPIERAIRDRLTGLGITEGQVHAAVRDAELGPRPTVWSKEDMLRLARAIRRHGKPMIVAANKADLASREQLEALASVPGYRVVPTCAEYELPLRKAAHAGLIDYEPGASSFRIANDSLLNRAQVDALRKIAAYIAKVGGTGVQRCVEEAAFKLLDLIVVFPVEDETHWKDKKGHVLPDALLVPRGTTAKDLAYRVHTDLGDNFIRAINGRTKRVVAHDHPLLDGDVIKIVART